MNRIQRKDFSEIGKIKKSHGVTGAVTIELSVDGDTISIDTEFLFLEIDGGLVPFTIAELEIKSKLIIAEFDELKSKEEADKLNNLPVFILTLDILSTETGEHKGPESLIGYTIEDQNRSLKSKIVDIIEYPNNPVFEILLDQISILIPTQDDLIESIDHENKIIQMDIPEGLIDMFMNEE